MNPPTTSPAVPLNQDHLPPGSPDNSGVLASRGGPRRFLVFLRRYWWVPLLTLLLAIGAGIGLAMWMPPEFVSAAAMWETERLHLSEGALFTEDASTYIGTQMELLKSGRMAQATLETLRASGTNGVPLGKDGQPLPVSLNFKEAPKSTVFVITASSADPNFSQNYLDALMTGYLAYKKNVRKEVSGETVASISHQIEDLERELKSDQDALNVFETTNNLAILQEKGTAAGGYLEKLETELSDLQLELKLFQASEIEQKTNSMGASVGGRDVVGLGRMLELTAPSTGSGGQLTPSQELELLKMQRAKLSVFLRPKHPKIVALDQQIAHGEAVVQLIRGQDHDQLLASENAVKMKMASVSASIKDWEGKVTESSSLIAQAELLRQNVNRSQNKFDRLKTLLENVDITRNTDLETLAILERASPAKRTYTQLIRAEAFILCGGLALGLGIVFLIEKRDDRFTCVLDVNSSVGDAVVGQLPEVRNGKGPLRLLESDDSRHGYAESYRNLRSALIFLASEGERPRVLLITSALPGEGKSTVAANLARALALSGSRVLLVDGDLRKGSLHHSLKLQSEPGLSELLRHTCDPEKVVQKDSLPNFAFVSRGSRPGNPGDLFLGSGLDEVLAQWRQEFDYVIIDSSPVFAADDASCLAPKVDGTLFVVRRSHSSARAVNEALNLLAQRQARLLGVIFNGADAKSRKYYFYKYAEYKRTAQPA